MSNEKVEIGPINEEEVGLLDRHLNFDWAASHKHRQRLLRQQHGEAIYLVAWCGSMPLGHVLLKWKGAEDESVASQVRDCADLEDLYVHPGHRSQGIGIRLMLEAEAIVRHRGISKLGLAVDVRNTQAYSLYERLGYRDAGLGEYCISWTYLDKDGQPQTIEETCVYLLKDLPYDMLEATYETGL